LLGGEGVSVLELFNGPYKNNDLAWHKNIVSFGPTAYYLPGRK